MKKRSIITPYIIMFFGLLPCLAFAANIYVDTPVTSETINNAIRSASRGDSIIVPDGTYRDIGSIYCNRSGGSSGNEYTLKAQTLGGVTFTGFTFINGTQPYWILRDFIFDDAWGTGQYLVRFDGAHHSRVTNCYFVDCGNAAQRYPYIITFRFGSHDSRVDHCIFERFDAIGVRLATEVGYAYTNMQVDHNYFKDVTAYPYSACIIVGNDSEASHDSYAIIEYNFFDNCNGDPELICLKSSNTTVRYNVFRNGKSITLRMGNDNIIESNHFLDNNISIRVFGSGHTIKNN